MFVLLNMIVWWGVFSDILWCVFRLADWCLIRQVWGVAYSPSGQLLASVAEDGAVHVHEVEK